MKQSWFVLVALLSAVPLAAQGAPASISLSLHDALLRADSASPAVGIAQAGTRSAEASVLKARSGYLPQINGSASYARTLASEFSGFASAVSTDTFAAPTNCTRFVPNPNAAIGDRVTALEHGLDCTANGANSTLIDFSKLPFGQPNTWTFGLSGSQTIFDRKIGGQVSAAKAGRDQADIEVDAQRAGAVLSVAQAYFDAQLAQSLVDIADSTLAQATRTFDQTRLERQAGNAAEFDQLRAGVARDNQTPVVIQRRAQRDQAFLRLRQVLDLPANVVLSLTTRLSDTAAVRLPGFAAAIATANDTSIDSRAPVREAAAAVRASDGTLRSARGERIPTLGLSSSYAKIDFPAEVFSFNHFLTDWSVTAALSVPIYNGGRLRADAMAAEAARDQAQFRLKQARQQAQLEQGDARTQLESAQAAFTASIGTVAQAQRAYEIAELRYQNGLSTLTDVGDARLQLGQAQANSAQAARDLQVARIRILLLRDLPFSGGAASAPQPAPMMPQQSTGGQSGSVPSTTVNPITGAPTTGTGGPPGGI